MKKQITTENKFRVKEVTRTSRNERRKSGDSTIFKDKVNNLIKKEPRKKKECLDSEGNKIEIDQFYKYNIGNSKYNIIVKVIKTDLKRKQWDGSIRNVEAVIIDSDDHYMFTDEQIRDFYSDMLTKVDNYVKPQRTTVIINKESLENMEIIKYNCFIIEDIKIDYGYKTVIKDSNISCGVKQYSLINNLFDQQHFKSCFYQKYFDFAFDFTNKDFYNIFCKKIMEYIFNNYTKAGFLIISTNETGNPLFKEINNLLANYNFITHRDTVNPNTQNTIRFWTCDLFNYQKTLPKKELIEELLNEDTDVEHIDNQEDLEENRLVEEVNNTDEW